MLSRSHWIAGDVVSGQWSVVSGLSHCRRFYIQYVDTNNARVTSVYLGVRTVGMLPGVVVTESYAPEDHVEEEEDHQVDDSTQVVDFVSLHPVRVPARVLSEGINLVLLRSRRRQLIIIISTTTSSLDEPQPWVDGFGLSTKNTWITILRGLR